VPRDTASQPSSQGCHQHWTPQSGRPAPSSSRTPMPFPLPPVPTGSCKLHLFQTMFFHNTNFVEVSSWATLEDIIFATLQNDTSKILYLYPWVYPALPAAEWENLENLFRVYGHNLVLFLSGDATLHLTSCEYQVLSTTLPKAESCEKELRTTSNSFPKPGLAGGQGMALILHQQDPQTTLSCGEVSWGHDGPQRKPWPHLAPLTPSHRPPALVSRHLISLQRNHLRKWSSRSKGPLCSCLWNWTHRASALPHTLVQHCLTKGRAPDKVPPSSYSPPPNVPSLPQSSASLFAMAANTAVGRGSSRTTNCRAQGRLLTRRVSTWCKAERRPEEIEYRIQNRECRPE